MAKIYLSRLLGERRWTQTDLVRRTGIRKGTINELYHGLTSRINLEHLDLICKALNCGISDLIDVGSNVESKCEPNKFTFTILLKENTPNERTVN